MKTTHITIEYPDKYTEEEVLESIIQELDIESLTAIGIKIYPEETIKICK